MMLAKGAEAVLRKENFLGIETVVKDRIRKSYRIGEIDEKTRRERNVREARLLHKAKEAGIITPVVLEVDDCRFRMDFVSGNSGRQSSRICSEMGRMLGMLHNNDIIHGDFTPNNIIISDGKMVVIDFGLGFISKRTEDKADDVVTSLYTVNFRNAFLNGYKKACKDSAKVMERAKAILKRVRYAT